MIVILALQLLQVPRYALSTVRRLSCALLRIIICRDAFDLLSLSRWSARLQIGNTDKLQFGCHYSRASPRSRNAERTPNRNDIVYSRRTTGDAGYVHLKFTGSIHHCACSSMVGFASARCRCIFIAQTRAVPLRPFAVEKDAHVSQGSRRSRRLPGVLRPFQINPAAFSYYLSERYIWSYVRLNIYLSKREKMPVTKQWQ